MKKQQELAEKERRLEQQQQQNQQEKEQERHRREQHVSSLILRGKERSRESESLPLLLLSSFNVRGCIRHLRTSGKSKQGGHTHNLHTGIMHYLRDGKERSLNKIV